MAGSQSNVGRIARTEMNTVVQTVEQGRTALTQSVRWLGFWLAIVLPAVYLPIFYIGIGSYTGPVFLGLLGIQLLAVFAGHNYQR